MDWYEDPNRARDEIRKAYWRGAWRMLGGRLAFLIPAAVLLPVFAQTKGGPKLDNRWAVARTIDETHREIGRWPTRFDEVRSRFHFRQTHGVAFLKLTDTGATAEYLISVDRGVGVFRLGEGVKGEGIKELRDRIATGTVYPPAPH